jgi:hypothetical protein
MSISKRMILMRGEWCVTTTSKSYSEFGKSRYFLSTDALDVGLRYSNHKQPHKNPLSPHGHRHPVSGHINRHGIR